MIHYDAKWSLFLICIGQFDHQVTHRQVNHCHLTISCSLSCWQQKCEQSSDGECGQDYSPICEARVQADLIWGHGVWVHDAEVEVASFC